VLPLEDREVWVEEGSKALEILTPCHLLFDVVGGVDEVIEHLLFNQFGRVILYLGDDLFDFVFSGEAAPEDELELSKHEQL